MYKGLGLCVLFTIGGFLLTALTGDRVSPLVFALVLGVIVGNLPMPWKSQSVEAGLKFSTRWLLRTGIVLFGFSVRRASKIWVVISVIIQRLLDRIGVESRDPHINAA